MPATRICAGAAGRCRKVSAIPATAIRKDWTPGACRSCCNTRMPDRDPAGAMTELAFLPYGRQEIGDADVKAVVEALVSGWLTTGPRVGEFEKAFAKHCGAKDGVAVNSGTAALHAAMRAIGLHTGDEVIVPAITLPPPPLPPSMKGRRPSSPMSSPTRC